MFVASSKRLTLAGAEKMCVADGVAWIEEEAII
jgi:hypothetical protein